MIVWNVAILALIVFGGNNSWQHSLYAGLQLWATGLSVYHTAKRKYQSPSEHPRSDIFIGTLFTAGLIYLLIGGAS